MKIKNLSATHIQVFGMLYAQKETAMTDNAFAITVVINVNM